MNARIIVVDENESNFKALCWKKIKKKMIRKHKQTKVRA